MPDLNLINSRQVSYKATYVPSTIRSNEQPQVGRALKKLAFVRGLNMQADELNRLRTEGNVDKDLLDLVERTCNDPSLASIRRYGPAIAEVRLDDLAKFGNALATIRMHQPNDLATQTRALTEAVINSGPTDPVAVGWMHLERLDMTPVGIEHGELVHSVPLTPNETVNITHREWTITTQTFESLIQDSLEGFSETGVTEKTDLTQATDTEAKHSSALDVNGAVSATYNGGSYSVTASAGVNFQQMSDDSQSIKDSVAHSVAITKQASSRTRKEHKMSFRVSSVAGAEDLAVQVITNPSDTNAMRVDYFQLLRRWRIDLIRYGLRMTYDIVIPNPGLALAQKVIQLQQLEQEIAAPHVFTVNITDITRNSWPDLAHQYYANVDPPPADSIDIMQTGTFQKSIDQFTFATIGFDMPDGYVVTKGHFSAQVHIGDGDFNSGHRAQINLMDGGGSGQFPQKDGSWETDLTTSTIIGRSGAVSLVYDYYNVESGAYIATIQAAPAPAAIEAWQVKVWNQLREADQTNYNANLQHLKDQQAQLESELNEFDALTLRKMEREEIMRFLLGWLIGPTFQLMPPEIQKLFVGYPDPSDPNAPEKAYEDVHNLTISEWQEVVQGRGELIKFLHNAIEWENVLFFVYPYFWDHVQNWPFKRFMVHPDPIHREFLRSGCARVVLTIRPGFEAAFANLLETGDPTRPPLVPTPETSS
ncbi:MAG TPA: hypothetical protein VFV38_24495 [Ktedonobacteraceae bacterium]|nr:hypothetical protein [Ktedonobacteraceae bacterium]